MRLANLVLSLSIAAGTFLAVSANSQAAEPVVSLQSLLSEMIDHDALARFPSPAYTCRQSSSYDRASVSPGEREGWFGNADTGQYLRTEDRGGRKENVLMDVQGPGAIVRFWATGGNHNATFRVYLDGADKPVIEAPVEKLLTGGALVGQPLAAMRANGMNLYLPIPYAKRCLVTYDSPDALYYQINYRTYPSTTKVESYSPEVFAAAKEKIAEVEKALLNPETQLPKGLVTLPSIPETLKQGQNVQIVIGGPAAMRKLKVKIEAKDMAAAGRSTVISIDSDSQPTAWAPVSDFFGSGVGINPFKDWWRSVEKDGTMTCYWPMPCRDSLVIEIKNLGEQDVKVSMEATFGPWNWDDRSMHFHTDWRLESHIDTTYHRDWNYLEAVGKGIYVGDTLALYNPSKGWWGEGDEKIYVDGEAFPSHFGTGTEDYYGYAWCTPEVFTAPFHAQPRADGPANAGHVTNTRVRLLDGIPFTKTFRFDMETWHWQPHCYETYAVTTYWYGMPGARGNHGPAPEQAKVIVPDQPKPFTVAGAMEAEDLKILEAAGGTTQIQENPDYQWSNNKQLWWMDAKPGDKLTLNLHVAKAGKYAVQARLTLAKDYGIVQLELDGKPLGKPIDCYNADVKAKTFDLETLSLAAGDHKLTVTITGANDKAEKRHMFGFDCLRLKSVP